MLNQHLFLFYLSTQHLFLFLFTLCQGAHEMTITILAVAGILTDDRPNEIRQASALDRSAARPRQ